MEMLNLFENRREEDRIMDEIMKEKIQREKGKRCMICNMPLTDEEIMDNTNFCRGCLI